MASIKIIVPIDIIRDVFLSFLLPATDAQYLYLAPAVAILYATLLIFCK